MSWNKQTRPAFTKLYAGMFTKDITPEQIQKRVQKETLIKEVQDKSAGESLTRRNESLQLAQAIRDQYSLAERKGKAKDFQDKMDLIKQFQEEAKIGDQMDAENKLTEIVVDEGEET